MLRLFSIVSSRIQTALSDPLIRFEFSLITLLLLTIGGTLAYMALEGWVFAEALYMTVITIATVGFGEVRELSDAGRMFTIVLIIAGVGAATTAISNAVSLALGPLLWKSIAYRRMQRKMERMDRHYIVCGYGRMGRQIVRDLQARDEQFVLIDADEELEEHLLAEHIPFIVGDATRDEVLQAAHIDRAQGVVAALSSDADNVMTVLTAREMNPSVFIVARVIRTESESKLRRAGANRVINPYQIGGHRMALTLLRPAVHDFLDSLFHFGDGQSMEIGQISVRPGNDLSGQTILDVDLRRSHNVSILAIKRSDGHLDITPSPQTCLNLGDTLIVIGPPESIYDLERRDRHSQSQA